MADCYYHGHGFSGPCPECTANERAGRARWDDKGEIYHPIFNPRPSDKKEEEKKPDPAPTDQDVPFIDDHGEGFGKGGR